MNLLRTMAVLAVSMIIACSSPFGDGSNGEETCSPSKPCAEGTCLYPQNDCSSNVQGTCVSPVSCDGPPRGPVCQCNGEVLEDPQADCKHMGQPNAPPDLCAKGTFACGNLACQRNAEVCVITSGGAQGNQTFACKKPSDVGGTCLSIPDCACLQPSQCASASCCTADADHQETVTINLP
jgi:hypothetical protein